jgi:hypothetical protein
MPLTHQVVPEAFDLHCDLKLFGGTVDFRPFDQEKRAKTAGFISEKPG